jgi:uncharacterized protein YvpB
LEKFLEHKIPVIVWITLELKEPRETDRWWDEKEREKEVVWTSPEHCALLVGYDERYYYVNDPHTGKTEYLSLSLFLHLPAFRSSKNDSTTSIICLLTPFNFEFDLQYTVR